MSLSLILVCLWALVANMIAMLPSRDNHWTAAYILMSLGAPILALTVYQHGVWIALLALCAGASLLRWPVFYLWRWCKRQLGQPV